MRVGMIVGLDRSNREHSMHLEIQTAPESESKAGVVHKVWSDVRPPMVETSRAFVIPMRVCAKAATFPERRTNSGPNSTWLVRTSPFSGGKVTFVLPICTEKSHRMIRR